ncbi:MAG: hypothetical protein ABSF29_10075 [Tepidisphaeraceae bacterium]|jgi:hypothetical protein
MAGLGGGRLMYMSWGDGPHAMEIAYSIWSAQSWTWGGPMPPIVIYTDDPNRFRRLVKDVIPVDYQQIEQWRGEQGYTYRAKIFAIADALQRFGCPIVMLDSDTYFLRDPWALLRRISPGRSLMHTWECHVNDSRDPAYRSIPARLRNEGLCDTSGARLEIPDQFDSFNSGVVGIHPEDARLLDEVVCVTDQMYRITGVRTCEQLALGYVMSRKTRLSYAWDVVYHYHTWGLRNSFKQLLPVLLADSADMPNPERLKWLYARRPRCRLRRRLNVQAQQALRRMGLKKQNVVFTSEAW